MFDRRDDSFFVRTIFSVALLGLLSGCGGSDRVEVYPTKGVVMFLGEPMLGGGAISFIPLDGNEGKAAGGTIDKEGKFTMSTYDPDDGSMAGRFRVIIMQSTADEDEYLGDTDGADTNDTVTAFSVPEAKRIPFEYADSAQSPLTVEVKPEGPNELTLELAK